jgi:hypothetical protein
VFCINTGHELAFEVLVVCLAFKKCVHSMLLCRERKLRRNDSGVDRLTLATNKLIWGIFSKVGNELKVYGDSIISSRVEILLGWGLHAKITFGRIMYRTRIHEH